MARGPLVFRFVDVSKIAECVVNSAEPDQTPHCIMLFAQAYRSEHLR